MKIFILLLLASLAAGCSSSVTLMSHRQPADGTFRPEQTVLLQEQKIAVGVQNDNEFLYLQITIPDLRRERQIVFQGLTIWLDYQGGEERRFGIRYPLPGEGLLFGDRSRGEVQPAVEGEDTAALTPVKFSDEIEILGPMEGEHHRLRMGETRGISIKLDRSRGVMTYLLTVPLSDNGEHLYGIGTRAGSIIGLGIESGSFMTAGMTPGGRGDGGGGPRMGGGGMGRGRRGGVRPPGDEERRLEPIKFWAKVQLAES